jgi:hypothetical protein
MNNRWFSIPRFFIFTFSIFLISQIVVRAQTIEPDEQIKLQMIAYLSQVENSLALSRPRIVQKQDFIRKANLEYPAKKSKSIINDPAAS